ncbi:MAG: hypothetical protein AB8G99_09455 [Planctomycetaceae bacterium]
MAASKKTLVVLLVLIGAGVPIICCGGGALLVNFGFNVVAEDLRAQLQDHPQIREHIGEIQSIEVEFAASAVVDDEDTFVYEIVGSKGTARATIKSLSVGEDEQILSATLRLAYGREVDMNFDGSYAPGMAEKPTE